MSVVGGCRLGVGVGGVCVCVSTSAVLYIRNHVSYTSRKRFVHLIKLLIIILNWTRSCCELFVL